VLIRANAPPFPNQSAAAEASIDNGQSEFFNGIGREPTPALGLQSASSGCFRASASGSSKA